MILSDLKEKYTNKALFKGLHRETYHLFKKHYPSKRHEPQDNYIYGFLCLIYDGIENIEELKKEMRTFFISATKQLVVGKEDLEDFIKYCLKQGLIKIHEENKVELTEEGKKLVELSYYNTLHVSHWLKILFNEKTIMIATVICLVILSILKITIGFQLASQGMISEGFENFTDLIKIGIIFLLAFILKKDKLASVIIIGIMLITGVGLVWSSIIALFNPAPIVPTIQSYLIGGFSIVINYGLMYAKSLIGRTSGNLSLLSDSKDSELNVRISGGVLIGLTFAIFDIYFVDAIVGIIISIFVFKEGIEVLRELFTKEEEFDITEIKVAADELYENRLTGYLLGNIRGERINRSELVNRFEIGLNYGRKYYGGFADFFYDDLGADIAKKHLEKLLKSGHIEEIKDGLILTNKGQKIFYKLKASEYKYRSEQLDYGSKAKLHHFSCLSFILILILLIIFADEINSFLANI